MFKDKLNGEPVQQFIRLMSKMYLLKISNEEKMRADEISTRIVRKRLKHDDYMNCLKNQSTTFEFQTRTGQRLHNLNTMQQKKKCSSFFDDKCYLLEDGISSQLTGALQNTKNVM